MNRLAAAGNARLADLLNRLRSKFARNVATLLAGNVVGQLIPIAVMPVLTRLYTPADFGLFAAYAAASGVLASLSTGQYQQAIVVPRSNSAALHLVVLALGIAAFVFLALIAGVPLMLPMLKEWLPPDRVGGVSWLLPMSVLMLCCYDVLYYLANRYGRYRTLSLSKVVQGSLFAAVALAASELFPLEPGLILGLFAGQLAACFWMAFALRDKLFGQVRISIRRLRATGYRFRKFPKHLIVAETAGALYGQLPVLFLTRAFDTATAGQFSLASRVISAPIALLAYAVGDVYRQRANEAFRVHGRFDRIMRTTAISLAAGSFLPFALLAIAAQPLFQFVFGPSWEMAGRFAQILAFSAFASFCTVPVDKGIFIVQATRYRMLWTYARLMSYGLICALAWFGSWGAVTFIVVIAVVDIGFYLFDLKVNFLLSRGA